MINQPAWLTVSLSAPRSVCPFRCQSQPETCSQPIAHRCLRRRRRLRRRRNERVGKSPSARSHASLGPSGEAGGRRGAPLPRFRTNSPLWRPRQADRKRRTGRGDWSPKTRDAGCPGARSPFSLATAAPRAARLQSARRSPATPWSSGPQRVPAARRWSLGTEGGEGAGGGGRGRVAKAPKARRPAPRTRRLVQVDSEINKSEQTLLSSGLTFLRSLRLPCVCKAKQPDVTQNNPRRVPSLNNHGA